MTDQPNRWSEDGYAVGRLIAYALKSARPAREGEYKQLLDRYSYEEAFAEAIDNVLEGLGLQALNETVESLRGGITLGCLGQNSPFAPNIESHARGLNREQRMALGIVHLGVMSFFYPQLDEEDDEFRSRAGTPSELGSDIRQICETLSRQRQQTADPEEGPPSDVRLAFEAFLALPPAPARGGFLTKSTQVGLVNHALQELQRNGFLTVDGGEGLNTRYVSLPKYRVYVRRLASHHAAQWVRKARQHMMDAGQGEAAHV